MKEDKFKEVFGQLKAIAKDPENDDWDTVIVRLNVLIQTKKGYEFEYTKSGWGKKI